MLQLKVIFVHLLTSQYFYKKVWIKVPSPCKNSILSEKRAENLVQSIVDLIVTDYQFILWAFILQPKKWLFKTAKKHQI